MRYLSVIINLIKPFTLRKRENFVWETIRKEPDSWSVRPHLLDYEKSCAEFSWDGVRHELDGLPGGQGLNIAHEAVDRHIGSARQDRLAMRWLGKDGTERTSGTLGSTPSTASSTPRRWRWSGSAEFPSVPGRKTACSGYGGL